MNPYTFTSELGIEIDWSGFIDQICPLISGHQKPIAKEELAVIVGRKQRQANLCRALKAMTQAGETTEANALVRQFLCAQRD